ncbi:hypothetical protein QTI51_38505 [Variovorax sp. J22G73]|nr:MULTISPECIES: hypothetical protein [unclassified Variovorax]MDM0010219.1 hypothetical protein [Variovorax sp. J22R203]MDM0103217.1 hypothetical protein [Variovorax sp. J22G73]
MERVDFMRNAEKQGRMAEAVAAPTRSFKSAKDGVVKSKFLA